MRLTSRRSDWLDYAAAAVIALALLLLALEGLGCATAEPEPMPERPMVACGPRYCSVDREFFDAMVRHIEECIEAGKRAPTETDVARAGR